MRAVVWHGAGDVRVEEAPDAPDPGPDEVRVAVEWCGVCGTDVEEYRAGPRQIPTEPHPATGRRAPLILGHEAVGILDKVGSGVSGLRSGQRIALDAVMSCGACWWCRRDEPNLCPTMAAIGLQADGGLAEYVTVPSSMCVPVPDEVDAATAALAEPLAVAVHALRRGRVERGSDVVIVGGGMVGLSAIHGARRAGANAIVLVEPDERRRRVGLRLGADVAVAPDEAESAVADTCSRGGADLVLEAAGRPDGAGLALRLVRRGGGVVLVGLHPATLQVDLYDVVLREIEIRGSLSHVVGSDFVTAVDLLTDGLLTPDIIGAVRVALTDAVTEGIARLDAPEPPVKVLVEVAR